MKKKNTIIVVVAILAIFIGGFLTIRFILNKEKDPITADIFERMMDFRDYIVSDSTYQFKDYSYIKKAYVTAPQNKSYQIEFYEMNNEINAIQYFNKNRNIFESEKKNSDNYSNIDFSNYTKYTLTSNDKYKVVSRIDNTMIYVNADVEYKDIIKEVLKELGY